MIFKRRRREAAGEESDEQMLADEMPAEADEELEDDAFADEEEDGEDEQPSGDEPEPDGFDRSEGPFDLAEVEPDAMAAERIDFGGIQIPLIEGLEIRLEVDQESNVPMAVTLVRGQGAVQVRAFAAPRSGGAWAEAVAEIRREFTEQGGTVDVSDGPFGAEVRTVVAGTDEQGRNVVQPIRFIGVEGPRWMLQGVLFGEGTEPASAADLEEVFRSVVVVRGEAAMRPGAPLPLALPEQVPGEVEADVEGLDDEGLLEEESLGELGGPNGNGPR